MSIILEALKKAKSLTSRKPAQPVGPAALASFQFGRRKSRLPKRLAIMIIAGLALTLVLRYTITWWTQRLAAPGGTVAVNEGLEPLVPPEQPQPLEASEGARQGESSADGTPEAPLEQAQAQPETETQTAERSVALPTPPSPPARRPARAVDRRRPPQPLQPEAPAVEAAPPREPPAPAAAEPSAPQPPSIQVAPVSRDPFELAVFYHRSRDYLKAFEMYNRVLEQDPLNAAAYNNMGLLQKEMGNVPEAIRAFRNAILIDPNYDTAHNNLGTTFMLAGQNSEATREFNRALQLNPNNAGALVNLGILTGKNGNPEQAKTQYLKALQINRNNPEAHYNLALVYEAQGETSSAIAHYREFLSLGSTSYPESLIGDVETKIDLLMRRKEGL
jgi:Tfp pilus assembly protein PilF